MKCKETTKSLKRSEITTQKIKNKNKNHKKLRSLKRKKKKRKKKPTNYKILCFAMYKI